jgi:undecaprenyl-diphosphatase
LKRTGSELVTPGAAFLIGIAQAFAILPGVSRSGWTIGTAIFLGVNRTHSVRFSFLLSIPAIAGAFVFELAQGGGGAVRGAMLPLLAGAVCAFAAGVLAIRILFSLSSRGRLEFFGVYCLCAGVLSLWLL